MYGDITQNIAAETLFEDLEDGYKCSLCEAPKHNFEKKIFIKKVSSLSSNSDHTSIF